MLFRDSLRATAAPVEIKTELRSRTSAKGGRSGNTVRENLGGESTRNINPWSKLVAKLLRALSLLAGNSPFGPTGLLGSLTREKFPPEALRVNHHRLRSSARRTIERHRTTRRMSASKKNKHTMVIPAIAPPDNWFPDEVAAAVVMVGDETTVPTVLEPDPSDDCEDDEMPLASAPGGGVPRAAGVVPTLTGAVCPPLGAR